MQIICFLAESTLHKWLVESYIFLNLTNNQLKEKMDQTLVSCVQLIATVAQKPTLSHL